MSSPFTVTIPSTTESNSHAKQVKTKIGSPSKELRLKRLKEQCVPRTALLDCRKPYELGQILEPPHRFHNPVLGQPSKDDRQPNAADRSPTRKANGKGSSKPPGSTLNTESPNSSDVKQKQGLNGVLAGVKEQKEPAVGDMKVGEHPDIQNDPDWTLVKTFLDVESECRSSSVLRKIEKPEYDELVSRFTKDDWDSIHNLVLERGVAVVKKTRTEFEKKQKKLDAIGVFHPDANARRVQGLLQVSLRKRLKFAVLEGEILEQIFKNSKHGKDLSSKDWSQSINEDCIPSKPTVDANKKPRSTKASQHGTPNGDQVKPSTKQQQQQGFSNKKGDKTVQPSSDIHKTETSSIDHSKPLLGRSKRRRKGNKNGNPIGSKAQQKPTGIKSGDDTSTTNVQIEDTTNTPKPMKQKSPTGKVSLKQKKLKREDPFDTKARTRLDREEKNRLQYSVYGHINEPGNIQVSFESANGTLSTIRSEQQDELRKRINNAGSETFTQLGYREPRPMKLDGNGNPILKQKLIPKTNKVTSEQTKKSRNEVKKDTTRKKTKKSVKPIEDDVQNEKSEKVLDFQSFCLEKKKPKQGALRSSPSENKQQIKSVGFTMQEVVEDGQPSSMVNNAQTSSIPVESLDNFMASKALHRIGKVQLRKTSDPKLVGKNIESTPPRKGFRTPNAYGSFKGSKNNRSKAGSIIVLRGASTRSLHLDSDSQNNDNQHIDNQERSKISSSANEQKDPDVDQGDSSSKSSQEFSSSITRRGSAQSTGSQAQGENNGEQVKTNLQVQLESLFQELEMPVLQRLSLILKYSKQQHVLFLNNVMEQWLNAAHLVTLRETVAKRLRQFLNQKETLQAESLFDSSTVESLQQADCYISPLVMFGSSPEDWLNELLSRLTDRCRTEAHHLHDEYGETLTYRGTPYLRVLRMSPDTPPPYTVNKAWKRENAYLLFE